MIAVEETAETVRGVSPRTNNSSEIIAAEMPMQSFKVEMPKEDGTSAAHTRTTSDDPTVSEVQSDSSFPDTSKPMSLGEQAARAAGFTLLSLLLMCFIENIVTNRMPDPARNPPLPDIMYELLPRLDIAHITDLIVWLSNLSVIAVALVVFPYRQYRAAVELSKLGVGTGTLLGSMTERLDGDIPREGIPYAEYLTTYRNLALRVSVRYAQTYGTAALMRCVSMLLTGMPTPPNDCVHPPHIDDPIGNAFIGLFSFGSANKHCGDLLFSGHTLVIALNASVLVWYGAPLVHRLLKPWAFLLVAAGAFTILSSRSHYSVDVFYAIYCATTIFYLVPEYLAPWLRPILTPLQLRRSMAMD